MNECPFLFYLNLPSNNIDDADYTRFYVRGEYELTEMFAAFGEFGMGNIETGDYGLTFGLGVKASILELGTGMWLGAIGSFTMINSSEEESYGWEKIEVEGSWSIFQALGIFDYSAIENLHLYGAFGFVIEKISAEANGYDVDADGEDLIYIGGGASYNVTPEIQIFAELSLLADMGFTVGAKYLLNL